MSAIFNARKIMHFALIAGVLVGALILSFHIAGLVENNDTAQSLVARFGYIGVVIIAVFGGLNALIPVPPATFVPIFLAGGLTLPLIITALAIGTIIADLIGFYLGRFGSTFVTTHYPRTYERFRALHETDSKWLPMFVFLYASLIPFPNEAYLIPFGILGVPLRRFIIPMMIGAFVHQTIAALGVETLLSFFS